MSPKTVQINTEIDYVKAVEKLNLMAYHYYTLDDPIATDSEYDELYFLAEAYEKENNHIHPHSPTQRVGDNVLDGFEKIENIEKMFSLDDIFSNDELLKWGEGKDDILFYSEPKYDGLSLNLLYDNGVLISAGTRGDGKVGENVTKNVYHVKGVPLNIEYTGRIEIRGEVVIFKDDFESINNERVKAGKKVFANERNSASGALRSLDPVDVKRANLRFTPYGVGYHELDIDKQSDIFKWILTQGFTSWGTNNGDMLCKGIADVEAHYQDMINHRNDYPMLLDGMVIKADSIELQEELGFTSKYPKWAVAYKFPAIEKSTRILEVIQQVGKTGTITPVAIVEPVNIEGAVVERATLHNYVEIAKKDIRIGDKVSIIRSGDVIPKILSVFTAVRDGSEEEIIAPTICPECGTHLIKPKLYKSDEEATAIRCPNIHCKGVINTAIAYSVSKKALNMDGFGESTVEALVEKGLIEKLEDIFSLREEELLTLDKFGVRKAKKTLKAIESAKGCELWRFINALNIETVGERASQKIVKAIGEKSIAEDIDFNTLIAIEDIGDAMAKRYVEFFTEHYNDIIKPLYDIIKPVYEVKTLASNSFEGINFVITGTLSQPRDYFKAIIESHGGKVSGSVSKKTSYLLCGEDAGSKKDKAQKAGVTILDENAFNALLRD